MVEDEIAWDRVGSLEEAAVPTDGTNLIVRALLLTGGAAKVRLVKRIPAGGGLGGGSADAAAVLRWRGGATTELAARLGADVPFCLHGGRAAVGGVGELLSPLRYEAATFVILTPSFPVSTPAAYAAYDELAADGRIPSGLLNELGACGALLVEGTTVDGAGTVRFGRRGEPPVLAGSSSTYFLECSNDRAATLVGELRGACRDAALPALVKVVRTTGSLGGWRGTVGARPLAVSDYFARRCQRVALQHLFMLLLAHPLTSFLDQGSHGRREAS